MKKILLILTITIGAIILSSCGRDQRVLRVGMDLKYPPFETVDTSNNPEGISVDIAYALGEFLGREVEIVNTDFGAIIPSIQSGEIDVAIASMSITEERKQIVDFSEPYFYFKIITLVNQNFATANGINEDTTVQELLAVENTRYIGIAAQVSASIPQSYGKEVTEATDLGTAVESVAQGTADVLLMSANPVVDGFKANPNTTMVMWDPFVASPIGMAVRKGNTELLEQVNAFIATFSEPDGLYDVLAAKWDNILLDRLGRYGLDFYINE
ncbi:transporter substrate-binding domain-containing protein [Peloplasma aerotolerans]|uniref:Transporter substrate-binding domain-containing protein n=1 Tax=Peloplasma aerotolerans TaxID=3044389 RepID=A0AAW6UAL9_9MOLU|nr:transporter substrate-binding domain-containing protein [Mariniplasma sp. M4Ah]MDI6452974.1 transporter substrate-binding domain-containing protein [Mariniplasma sp. M4Ah]